MSREEARGLYVADYQLFEALTPKIKKSPYARDYFHVLRNDLYAIFLATEYEDQWDKNRELVLSRMEEVRSKLEEVRSKLPDFEKD